MLSLVYIYINTSRLKLQVRNKLVYVLNSKKLIKQGFFHGEAHYIGRLCQRKAVACEFLALFILSKSNRKVMNRNWCNQKANPALKTKTGNK